jgi:IS5 family transposase
LAPAIARVANRAGRAPTAVTADRGYGYAAVEAELHELGVKRVAIPRANKPSAARREFEHRKAFRSKIKWRTGCEGRINHLKRSYGWNRTELTTLTGARTWCGNGVFAPQPRQDQHPCLMRTDTGQPRLVLPTLVPAFAFAHLLFVFGVILLVVGVILAVLGSTGRAVGGRRHHF